ncbi:relaxase/mobilization nuclease-like protein [Brachybacterium sp. AG952]|uniref:relaxase/mobilization nuclease domain-containing protein n=1 Tax=Brachybacterium sp. AG952 TaxID=2183989 RepID=UPI0010614CDD|nr:relaxase/mobilization nuclease domain-containing protein [Brachybacterium sp. AG952]TDP79753.1 relaxase/mobilization nuclease-like protein [Brachybacterium sp. AG952]
MTMAERVAAVVMASPTRNVSRLNRYVRQQKEGQTDDRFVAASGINGCSTRYADQQMRDNRKRWAKDGQRVVTDKDGKQIFEGEYVHAYHVIQSFARDGEGALNPEDTDDWEKAHDLGRELAKRVAGESRYATVHTQIDGKTGCIHNHLVIDSIDRQTGRSFDSSHVKHAELVKTHDGMLRELGYEQVNEYPEPGVTKTAVKLEKSELRGLQKHKVWEADGREGAEPFSVAVLKDRISATLEQDDFTDFESFARAARANGVDAEERGKGVSYAMLRLGPDGADYMPIATSDKRRASKLGRDFEKTAIEAAIERNIEAEKQRAKAPKVPERELPVDPVASRLDAIMADAPAHEAALDDVMLSEPEPPAAQGAQVEDEDLEVAPRRRRRATTDEDRDRDETAPTVSEPAQAPQTAQEPVVAPPAAHEAAEPSEARQEPRAYTRPREPEQPKKVEAEKPAPKKAFEFDGLFGVNRTGLEMIALQSARNPQKLDIQLRAGTADAAGHQVLSLGKTAQHPSRFRTYAEHKLAQIERAAGSNRAEVEGGHVLGFRADVKYNDQHKLWLPERFEKSQLEPVTPDTMRQQVEAQRDARMRGLVSRSRQKKLDMNAQRHQMPEISRDHDRGYGLGG